MAGAGRRYDRCMAAPTPPGPLPPLTPEEELRYGRHLDLPEVGPVGQRRIKAARVLLVGAGGLGSPVALYLAAAGVGQLGIVDPDKVERSNLQRQVLHGTRDLERPKVDSALDRLRDLNPGVEVLPRRAFLAADNAAALIEGYDLVVDGADNFATRYVLSDACVRAGKPCFHGSVFRFEGQVTVLCAPGGPCYRCLYPEPPPAGAVPSCAEVGVLGVVPGLVGLLQASEVLKWITGAGTPLVGRLLLLDALGPTFRTVNIHRDPDCPACGRGRLSSPPPVPAACTPASAVAFVPTLSPAELRDRRSRGDDMDLVDVREPDEWAQGRIEGARLSPLSSLSEALPSFDPARDVVLYCRTGVRSAQAVRLLQAAGLTRVFSLAGGIKRWEAEAATVP